MLAGAVIAAPLFKRIGLGTVLGYLATGIIIAPFLRYFRDPEQVLHFAELGVVMLLFIIGLELRPSRLWSMRYDIFGMGVLQIVICGFALSLLVGLFIGSANQALVAGFGLALSSTAFAVQMLEDTGEINTLHGRKALAILLAQDMAIVPLLALLPLLARGGETEPGLAQFLIGLAAIAFLILAGRYLLNPILRVIAKAGAREAMIAAALLLVFGSAMLMYAVGLSMRPYPISAQPTGVGQFKDARKAPIIGQQQQALGGNVEPPDRQYTRQRVRQFIEHRRPAFRVAIGRHQPGRLVVEPKACSLGRRQRISIDLNAVGCGDDNCRRCKHASIEAHTPRSNPGFSFTSGTKACAGDPLCDTLALLGSVAISIWLLHPQSLSNSHCFRECWKGRKA